MSTLSSPAAPRSQWTNAIPTRIFRPSINQRQPYQNGENRYDHRPTDTDQSVGGRRGGAYFCGPGEENLDLVEALRQSSIRLILTRHEQGAAFMAAIYGRLTGKPRVCMASLGPGATNLATPVAYAHLDGFPLIMITGQKPIKKSKQGQFQIVDIVSLFDPIYKMAKQIVHGNTIPSLVREAFRVAGEERPGAVLLELPEDIAEEPCDAKIIVPHKRYYAVADDAVLADAVDSNRCGRKPSGNTQRDIRLYYIHRHTVLCDPDGQGRCRRTLGFISGYCCLV